MGHGSWIVILAILGLWNLTEPIFYPSSEMEKKLWVLYYPILFYLLLATLIICLFIYSFLPFKHFAKPALSQLLYIVDDYKDEQDLFPGAEETLP